jgi:hypothetical protein
MALTAVERSERAKEAAAARWGARDHSLQQWHDMELGDAMAKYAEMRVQMEEIGRIIAQRQPAQEEKVQVQCHQCDKTITGRAVYTETYRDKQTGILMNLFVCDTVCHTRFMKTKMGGVIRS